MNRYHLLDSLDGLKGLVFRLLPADIRESIACVPMTTDGPWTNEERVIFQSVIGIPGERTHWNPGGFGVVPRSSEHPQRTDWINAVAAIEQRYLFLDPDVGFHRHRTGDSRRMILISELEQLLNQKEVLIVYRHQWWPPNANDIPENLCTYVWQGLTMLRNANLASSAYQSQTASLFFVAERQDSLAPFQDGLRGALAGVDPKANRFARVTKEPGARSRVFLA